MSRCSFRILQLINVCFDNICWARASWRSKCAIISLYRPEEIALLTCHTKHRRSENIPEWCGFIRAGSGSCFMNRTCVRSGVLMNMWVIIKLFCFTHWHVAVQRSRDAVKAPVGTLERSDRCRCLFWALIWSARPELRSSWITQTSFTRTHVVQTFCWRCFSVIALFFVAQVMKV